MKTNGWWGALAVCAIVVAAPAVARAQGSGPAWTEQLEARGITSSANATGMWIGNVAGGLEKGGV